MIFTILRWLWVGFLKLLIPPPNKPPIPKIDPNAPCPSCGATDGQITAVNVENRMLVRHQCHVCRATWHEQPVLRVSNVIHEDKQDKKE